MASANNGLNNRLISYKDARQYKLIKDIMNDVKINPSKYLEIPYIKIFLLPPIKKNEKDIIKCLLETLNQIYGFCVMNFDYLSKLSSNDYKKQNNNRFLSQFDISYKSISARDRNEIIAIGLSIRENVNLLLDSNKTNDEKIEILLDALKSLFEFNCGETGGKYFFYHVNSFIEKITSSMKEDKDKKYFDKYIKDIEVHLTKIDNGREFIKKFNSEIKLYSQKGQNFNQFIIELLNKITTQLEETYENKEKYKQLIYKLIYNLLDGNIEGPIDDKIFRNTFSVYSDKMLEFINKENYEDINLSNCEHKDIIYYKCPTNTKFEGTIYKLCPLLDINYEKPEINETRIKGYIDAFKNDYCQPFEINRNSKGGGNTYRNNLSRISKSKLKSKNKYKNKSKNTKKTQRKYK